MTRVELTRPFSDDALRQVGLLLERGEWARVVGLMQELAVLQERLERFPELGHELRAHDGHALRRIALGRVPYFVWYRFDPRSDVVRLVRLFHAHQNTPRLRLP